MAFTGLDGGPIKRVTVVDSGGNPVTPVTISDTQTLTANNTTANVPIFGLTGQVEVLKLYGVVTTALSSAVTAAFWRLNDQTATVAISLATGTALSSLGIGSLIGRSSVAAVALTADNATAGKVRDPVAATAPDVYMPFALVQKTGGVTTNIEFTYTTTNTPASGVIVFYCQYIPLTPTSSLVAL